MGPPDLAPPGGMAVLQYYPHGGQRQCLFVVDTAKVLKPDGWNDYVLTVSGGVPMLQSLVCSSLKN